MNLSPTSPFSLVYFNANHLPAATKADWEALVASPSHDPSMPTTPLLYDFVESGYAEPRMPRCWTCLHQPGPAGGGGGISLLYHSDCAVQVLRPHCHRIDPPLLPTCSASSAVECALVRPKHRDAFLLAVVYLPPQCAKTDEHLLRLLSHVDAAGAAHPQLPLLMLGDFNCHHADWGCPMASTASACANALAAYIPDASLTLCSPSG